MAATGIGTACSEVGLGPNEAAAIELDPFPSPSVVVGDTLRNIDGVVTPVRARVFNVRGDVIDDPLNLVRAYSWAKSMRWLGRAFSTEWTKARLNLRGACSFARGTFRDLRHDIAGLATGPPASSQPAAIPQRKDSPDN